MITMYHLDPTRKLQENTSLILTIDINRGKVVTGFWFCNLIYILKRKAIL